MPKDSNSDVHILTEHGGILSYTIKPSYPKDYIYIYSITVDRTRRRCGIGTKLLSQIKDKSEKLGFIIELYPEPFGITNMSQADLIAWYKRRGFEDASNGRLRYLPSTYSSD